jgi:hypothetical protein
VPPGAATVVVDGATIHVWQFPHDPYLPGLAAAVNRAEAARLLRRLDLPHDEASGPAIRTRSYRPTRRAVVEVRPAAGRPPVAYVKLLGARDRLGVRRRAERLAAVHEHLRSGLPVPPVLRADEDVGRVVLGALPGTSLRRGLREGEALPDPEELCDLLRALHRLPPPPGDADPDGYADASRHAVRLARALPERADAIARVAAVAATVGGPRGTVHGDLHDGQLLVARGTVVGLLDVDGCGHGSVAHDLGRLVAHVEASELAVPAVADRAAGYGTALRRACGTLAPARDVAAACAGAWLGLATGPLRVASSRWRAEAGARIERGLRWADQAG